MEEEVAYCSQPSTALAKQQAVVEHSAAVAAAWKYLGKGESRRCEPVYSS